MWSTIMTLLSALPIGVFPLYIAAARQRTRPGFSHISRMLDSEARKSRAEWKPGFDGILINKIILHMLRIYELKVEDCWLHAIIFPPQFGVGAPITYPSFSGFPLSHLVCNRVPLCY
ncbi:hypothetical protein F5Y08DRAFT_95593 [Xylaria arbuscula]|nr:hypothetical protein F5Y08DRAFT_95593 [Xylaria arbuscula]